MSDDEINKLLEKVHKSITVFNYNSNNVPCIILTERRFSEIMNAIAGRPVSVDTNLNILQNGLGNVFVEVTLDFSDGDIHEKILLYANESLDFFESLAKTSMLALSSPHSQVGQENVFMIQLPRPEKATNALDVIKRGLKAKEDTLN
ncbi:MAG TPA: hypothetical protein VLA01_00145 [Nitrosopumilaceae archaeon]|nr:hypothetical protein [Nitrosopumilaceae archaeon]